jgi:LPS-assembly lipoprotein
MTRSPLVFLLMLSLAACGFQLRDALTLPPDLGPVQVAARDPYSALRQSLETSLESAGATVVPTTARDAGVSTLRIVSELWDSEPIAVDERGRAQEFSLRYAAVFVLERADGTVLVPRQAVELSRDYVSLPGNSTGTESERELLAREMQREMTASILRRIDAASRLTDGGEGEGEADVSLPLVPEGGDGRR